MVLGDLDLSYRTVEAEIGGSEKGEGRRYKGHIELIFTDRDILDALREEEVRTPTLFMFDRVRGCEEGAAVLYEKGIRGWKEFSGFETRSSEKMAPSPGNNYILATSAGEVGINLLDLEVAHIEPGRYLENFWQRMGRAARGRDARIVVHTTAEMVKSLPLNVDDHYGLAQAMEEVLTGRNV